MAICAYRAHGVNSFFLPPYLAGLRRALHRAEEAPQPPTAARVMNPVAKALAPLALAATILPPMLFLFKVINEGPM